jgi:hypothetical protein
VVSLRDGAALFVDLDGRVRGRCDETAPAPPRAGPRARHNLIDLIDAEDVLRLAGLPDDDDGSPEAEDALEDEGLGPRPRARTAPAAEATDVPTVTHALAAAPRDVVWLATSTGSG